MINNFYVTLLVGVFLIRTVKNTLALTYLWQLKEYRFDRLFVHLRETSQGRNLILGFWPLLKWFLIFLFPISFFNSTLALIYPGLVLAIFLIEGFFIFQEIASGRFKRPIFTLKAIFIIFSALVFQLLLLNLLFFDLFFWVLILDKLLSPSIAFFVFLLSFPTELSRDKIILRASKKLQKQKKLLVIGVTGSYGKSSTKEFISCVLAKKFKVLKTPGTNNTPIGVAKTILEGLKKETQIFVVEMAAYKKGEIAQVCEMVRPKIGVLTGISFQHLSLFGSFKNILSTKYELIEALPKKQGLAIFNGENIYCRELYEKTKIKKMIYSFGDESTIKVSKIKAGPKNISFGIKIGSQAADFTVRLLGVHSVENLLPAILIGKNLGMSFAEIKWALSEIDYLPQTMKPYKSENGAIFIDDTFNASPDAVLAAMEYLKIFKKKKILVLQPLIELGSQAALSHYELGMAAGKFLDKVFLTNKNFSADFKCGLKQVGNEDIVEVLPLVQIAARIEQLSGAGDGVVFEGKESGLVLKRLSYV